jgi:hemerythrin-like domain-containing protein
MEAAIALIQREHDALGRVLRGLEEITNDIVAQRIPPDFDLLAAMLYYIDQFPERFHHPREESTLFPLIRARTQQADQLLNSLQSEHQRGTQLASELALKLVRFQGGGRAELSSFASAVSAYLPFNWAHMRAEEDDLLPIAERVLSPADWATVEAAFASNDDPIFGRSQDPRYSRVYSRIVNLAPRKVRIALRGS